MSEKIVQFNEEVIKGQIKELVRGSAEETLNELLEAEAKKLTQAARYERNEHARATAAATTAVTSLPLPEMLLSKCRNSRGSLLKLPSLSDTVAVKVAWKKLSLKCI